jgi:hypothetical protein
MKESDQQSIGLLINNANNAVVQTKFRDRVIVEFTDAVDMFYKTVKDNKYTELKKAHDALLYNLVKNSTMTGDKMMTKFLDKKEFLGSQEEIKDASLCDQKAFNDQVLADISGLSDMITISDQGKLEDVFGLADQGRLTDASGLSDKGKYEDASGLSDKGKYEDASGLSDKGKYEDASGLSDKGKYEDASGLSEKGKYEDASGFSDKGKYEDASGLSDKGNNLQSENSLFDASALSDALLTDINQFLSSENGNFYFDAHALESSPYFSDQNALNDQIFQDAGFLSDALFDAGALNSQPE